jgi:hypothetical protein
MTREVHLNQLRTVIDSFEYPISKAEAREEAGDVRLLYADGAESLPAVLSRTNTDTFDAVEDLESEIYSNLPVEAVGEPGQSEGDA